MDKDKLVELAEQRDQAEISKLLANWRAFKCRIAGKRTALRSHAQKEG